MYGALGWQTRTRSCGTPPASGDGCMMGAAVHRPRMGGQGSRASLAAHLAGEDVTSDPQNVPSKSKAVDICASAFFSEKPAL